LLLNLTADFFSLFELPRAFRLNAPELDVRFRDVQARVHPDRFVNAPEGERRLSMQWATRANEAYQALKKPLNRARYLLELHGHDLQAENNTAMSADFLIEQMEWREAVQEARGGGDHDQLEHLHDRLRGDIASRYDEVGRLLDDDKDYPLAADRVRRLMFLEKLLSEIDDALASLDE
jgi:molecular chaperone HscB